MLVPMPGWRGGCEPFWDVEELKPLLRVGTAGFTWQAARSTLLVTHQLGAGSESYVRAA